ncbi:MAG TPA: transposase [Burkholderiales bacterium]|nr:transposase [Burkholderiales bacterium]
MPRQARFIVPDIALHVIQRGHNRNACFRDDTDRMVYLATVAELLRGNACALHAYCLMTNHIHMLLTPATPNACATLMRNLGQRYAQYFNRRYDRTGALWEGRYRSCLIDSANYILACYRYVERNPVRADMVSSAAAYRWSSYQGNTGRALNRLLTPHVEYLALGNDESTRWSAYQQMLDVADEPGFLTAIRDATNGGLALVDDALKAKLQTDTGRRLEHKKPGPAPANEALSLDLVSGDLGF